MFYDAFQPQAEFINLIPIRQVMLRMKFENHGYTHAVVSKKRLLNKTVVFNCYQTFQDVRQIPDTL